jgi:hypothetical protein
MMPPLPVDPADPRRLAELGGPSATVVREYARRTRPDEVERWLPGPDRARSARGPRLPRAALAGGLVALLGIWLTAHPTGISEPGAREGVGGAEGASGIGLGAGGGRGTSGGVEPSRRALGEEPSG